MLRRNYGVGLCSHVAPGAEHPSPYEKLWSEGKVVDEVALFPILRLKGLAAVLRLGLVHTLYLFGTDNELRVYIRYLVDSLGVDRSKIVGFPCTTNTKNAFNVVRTLIDDGQLHADDWMLVAQNYHRRRAELACESHGVLIPDSFGTEEALLFEALQNEGTDGQAKMRTKMLTWDGYDNPEAELAKRLMYEWQGSGIIDLKPEIYKVMK